MPDPSPEAPVAAENPAAAVATPPPASAVPEPPAPQPKLSGAVVNEFADKLASELAAADALFSGKATEPTSGAPEAPAPAAEPEAPVVEAQKEEEPAPEVPVKKADELPDGIERPRLQDPQDQVIAALKKANPSLTWAECEERVKGASAAQKPAETAPVANPVEAELAEIQAALDAHAEAGDLVTPEIRRMQRREAEILAEQKAQAIVAPILAKEAQREEAVFLAAREESKTKAIGQFPAGYTDGTPLNAKFLAEVANAQNPNHPGYMPDLEKKTNAPEILLGRAAIAQAEEDAAAKGISFAEAFAALKGKPISAPQAKAAALTTPPQAATPARKPVVTAPGSLATRAPDRAPTQDETDKQIRSLNDPDEIAKILIASANTPNGKHAVGV